jgi:hypothetical protein
MPWRLKNGSNLLAPMPPVKRLRAQLGDASLQRAKGSWPPGQVRVVLAPNPQTQIGPDREQARSYLRLLSISWIHGFLLKTTPIIF